MLSVVIICCLALTARATAEDKKIGLDDLERDYLLNSRASKTPNQVSSPTKFGFVPARTAESYAATKPKQTYFQDSIRVKQPNTKYTPHQAKYSSLSADVGYSQDYSNAQQQYPYLQPDLSSQQQSQSYQQPAQQYQYQQVAQHYQYQQPSQQYQQYENVQYLTENSLAQSDGQQYYAQAPQYYYVQQYQAPTTSVETVVDPKAGVQYVMYLPTSSVSEYSQNAIQADEKYQNVYSEYQTPTTSVKYTSASPKKYTTTATSHRQIQAPKVRYQKEQEYLIKREPKSLLDSYIPSHLQLRYLEQTRQNKKYS